MKKKIFAILMVTLLAISLVGCGGSKQSKEEKKQDEAPNYAENIVGYDDGKLVITATSIKREKDGGLTLNLTAENKTDNEEYFLNIFAGKNYINNYYHVNPSTFHCELGPGETGSDEIRISGAEIAGYGIEDVYKIDLCMLTKFMSDERLICSFLTYGQEMDIEKPAEPKGQCYLDGEYCSVYLEKVENENGLSYIVETRNKSDKEIGVDYIFSLNDPDMNNWHAPVPDAEGKWDEIELVARHVGTEQTWPLYAGRTLIPGSIDRTTYMFSGQIMHHDIYANDGMGSYVGSEETNDIDFSTIYVTVSITSKDSPEGLGREYFTITN